MPAAGARPKDTKINLMDCICLCSEVEIWDKYALVIFSEYGLVQCAEPFKNLFQFARVCMCM